MWLQIPWYLWRGANERGEVSKHPVIQFSTPFSVLLNGLRASLPNSILTCLSCILTSGNFLKIRLLTCLELSSNPPFLDSKASSLIYLLLDAQQLTLSRCLCNGWTSLESKTFLDVPPPSLSSPPPVRGLHAVLQTCCCHFCLCAHSVPLPVGYVGLCVVIAPLFPSIAARTTLGTGQWACLSLQPGPLEAIRGAFHLPSLQHTARVCPCTKRHAASLHWVVVAGSFLVGVSMSGILDANLQLSYVCVKHELKCNYSWQCGLGAE